MQEVTLQRAIPFVAAAYMGIWLILFVYLLVVGRHLTSLHKELTVLSELVKKKSK